MYPFLVVFGKQISVYGLCAFVGLLALLFCVYRLARMRGKSGDDEIILVLVCLVPMLIGGVLLYGLTNIGSIAAVLSHAGDYRDLSAVLAALVPSFTGIVFYGGLFGALAAVAVWCRVRRESFAEQLDIFAVAIPLFHVFGRVGCFMGGCCFGIESPFGFVYTVDSIAAANGVSRFPVQLLEAGGNAVIFLVLLHLFRAGKHRGDLVFGYFLSYGTLRFFDEFLRGDAYRGFLGPLSTSQWISLGLIAFTLIFLLVRAHRRKRDSISKSNEKVGPSIIKG